MRKDVPLRKILRQLGRRIAATRRVAGLTQVEAAEASGISLKRWQRVEHGAVNATVQTLATMAAALEVDVWQLLTEPAAPDATQATPKGR